MKLVTALVLALCATASADTPTNSKPLDASMQPWRVKINAYADGEVVGWPKHQCSDDVNDHLRRILLKHPYVEVIDGKMAARIDEKRPVPAHRQTLGSTFSAFYDVTDTRTIVFTIRWQNATGTAKDGTVPVEVSIISSDVPGSACRETWLGNGKRI